MAEEGEPQLAPLAVDPAVLASKRVVFIGALPDEATVTMVRAAMIPFGDIKSVDMVCSMYMCCWRFFFLFYFVLLRSQLAVCRQEDS